METLTEQVRLLFQTLERPLSAPPFPSPSTSRAPPPSSALQAGFASPPDTWQLQQAILARLTDHAHDAKGGEAKGGEAKGGEAKAEARREGGAHGHLPLPNQLFERLADKLHLGERSASAISLDVAHARSAAEHSPAKGNLSVRTRSFHDLPMAFYDLPLAFHDLPLAFHLPLAFRLTFR